MPVRTGRGQHLQRHVHSPVSHAPSHARPHYPCAFAKTYERTATRCPACPRALWAAATGMGIAVQSAVRAQILATALLRRPRHYHQAAVSRARRGASRRAAVAVCSESAVSRQSVCGLSAICRRFPGEFDHGWAEPTIQHTHIGTGNVLAENTVVLYYSGTLLTSPIAAHPALPAPPQPCATPVHHRDAFPRPPHCHPLPPPCPPDRC